MSRSILFRAAGLLTLLLICTSVFWLQPIATFFAHAGKSTTGAADAAAAPRLTFHQYADGPYKVQGNQVIGADGQPYIFHGVGRDGYEFSCTGGGSDRLAPPGLYGTWHYILQRYLLVRQHCAPAALSEHLAQRRRQSMYRRRSTSRM